MEFFNQLSKFMKAILIAALLLLIYGYVCRWTGIYFFWESKSIGWVLLFIALIGLLMQRIKMKKMIQKKSIFEKIAIGFIIFLLFVKTILLLITPFTDAYAVATTHLRNDSSLRAEIGTIRGFSIIPQGGLSKSTENGKDSGAATITLIVKGEKKFKEVTVFVVKYEDQQEWVVEGIE
jgi:FtsH-binding integral membrane protein